MDTTNRLRIRPSATIVLNPVTDQAWYHCFYIYQSNGQRRFIINGETIGVDASSAGGDQTSTTKFTLGSDPSTIQKGMPIAYFALYLPNDATLGDPSLQEVQTIARKRFAMLTGMYPQLAKGRQTPILSNGRSDDNAWLDTVIDESTGERRLFRVGQYWPRVVKRKDTNGQYLVGLLSEPQVTNNCRSSNDFTDLNTWAINGNVFHITGNYSSSVPLVGPFGINTGSTALVYTGATATALLYEGVVLRQPTAALRSVYFKPNVANCCQISNGFDTVRFEFSGDWTNYPTITYTGTPTARAAFAEYIGNKWWRVYYYSDKVSGYVMGIVPGISGSYVGTANGLLACWVAGAQCETPVANQYFSTSYVESVSGSTTTKNADDIRFDIDDNISIDSTSITLKYLSQLATDVTGSTGSIFSLGLNNTNHVRLNLTTDGGIKLDSITNSATQYSLGLLSASVNNNTITTITSNIAGGGGGSLYRDGILQANSSSNMVNQNLTGSLYLGSNLATSNKQTSVGIIGDLKIFNKGRQS